MKTKLFIIFSLFTNLLFAQIGFEHISEKNTWSMILQKAQQQKKLIFVDAYAVWCGPCKFMERNIFPNPEVGTYYNQHFISVSVDMETKEGREFAKTYPVEAYPTLLFINAQGKVVRKKVGAVTEVPEFINLAKWIIQPELNPLTISTKKYNSGNYEKAFLIEHMGNLIDNDMDINPVIQVYLKNVKPLTLDDEHTFSVFYLGVNDLSNPLMKDFAGRVEELSQIYGGEAISNKVSNVIEYNMELSVKNKDKKLFTQLVDFVNVVFAKAPDKQSLIDEINKYYTENTK